MAAKKKDNKFKSDTPAWIYFRDADTDKKYNLGFTYKITNTSTGKIYIGQKKFWAGSKPPSGYKTKKPKESAWKSYWSSCNELNAELLKFGTKNFKREIIKCYANKWDMSYNELLLQLQYDVLSPHTNTYNSYIGCRLRKRK